MIPTYEKDNKERIPFEHYKAVYEKQDPKEISARTGLPYDEEKQVFTLNFLYKTYEVSWPGFAVNRTEEDGEFCPLLEMDAARILVIRHLTEGCAAVSTGNFLTYREMPWGEVYFRQFSGRCIMRLAFSYGNRLEVFNRAMERLGAEKLELADASWEFEILDGFPVRFLLWAGDEEFPPSAQILFGDNFPIAFHTEDLAVIGDISITTLKKLA